jgi:hypothetical protein
MKLTYFFIEQEITGDVLLKLDMDLLKTEIGIMAFGKRSRIVNLIDDLKRPSFIVESQKMNPENSFSHARTRSSLHKSYSSPFLFSSPVVEEPEMPLSPVASLDSPPHTGDISGTSELSKGRSRGTSDPGSVNGSLIGTSDKPSRKDPNRTQNNRPPTPTKRPSCSKTDTSDILDEDGWAIVNEVRNKSDP